MGQTLTHGVYLPDEGERNCYAGLAANWQILDSSVGTIAEHTSALAGKAPLVHTHTKSDVTDLLNSNFIPSANNSYDLGSSSYQWNNLYAKNYYYNGVAWGLDKYNQWTGVNDFNNLIGLNGAELWFKNKYIDDFTTNPAELGGQSVLQIWNKNTTQYSGGLIDYQMTDGSHILEITCFGYPLNDSTPHQHRFRFAAYRDGVADFYPTLINSVNLGTSYNKWKTLNGINPGALSLPKTDTSVTAINTSSFSFDGSDERVPDTVNLFSNGVALVNGWLCARLKEGAGHYIFINSDDTTGRYGICSSCFSSGIVSTLSFGINVYVPIKAGDKPAIRWAKPNGGNAQLIFYPCFGNV